MEACDFDKIPFDEPWDGQLLNGSHSKKKVKKNKVEKEHQRFVYKHKLPRSKSERKKLPARTCDECIGYYKAMGLSKSQEEEWIQRCSRHRYHPDEPKERPSTPEHFWKVHLSPTPPTPKQPCPGDEERGLMPVWCWMERGYSEEEANKMNEKILKKRFQNSPDNEEEIKSRTENSADIHVKKRLFDEPIAEKEFNSYGRDEERSKEENSEGVEKESFDGDANGSFDLFSNEDGDVNGSFDLFSDEESPK